MMMNKFKTVDINAILLVGFSTPGIRLMMAVLSVILLLIVDVMIFKLLMWLPQGPTSDLITAVLIISLVLHCIHTDTFILKTWAAKTVDLTPFKALYRDDQLILKNAVIEIIRISNTISFEGGEVYKKLNTEVSLETNRAVMEQIKARTFNKWLEKPANLKDVSELIYQCYLTEEQLKKACC